VKDTKDSLGKDEPQLPYFEEKLAEIVIFRQFGSWTIAKTKQDSEKEFTFLSDTSSQIFAHSACGRLPVHLPHKIEKETLVSTNQVI
jgi:hypothetical protein